MELEDKSARQVA